MMTRAHRFILFLSVSILTVLPGCDSTGPGTSEVVEGPTVSVEGGGTAYAWVRLGSDDQPEAIGVSFSEAAYESLTDTTDEHSKLRPKHDGPAEVELAFPDAAPAPYDHATVDWWPEGHPPPNVYTVPHFDAHFYFISPETRTSIEPGPAETFPSEQYVPGGYVADSVNVPGDGMHYLNTSAPEFNGEPFTHTFIYGFYEGSMSFIEPMAASDVLSADPDVTAEVPQPEAYKTSGMYPMSYRITHDDQAGEYRIVLDELVRRGGS
jgi:hypothetical protein